MTQQQGSCGTWVEHFPGNLRWSNATQIIKGMTPFGAVSMEQIDRVGQRMQARLRAGDDQDTVWREEWCRMAQWNEKQADKAAAEGRQMTAGNFYLRAGNYYYSGERFVPPGEEKMAIYRKALRCYRAGIERRYPQIGRVDVPYEKSALCAYFLKAEGVTGKAPTLVIFNGMDNCKEMNVIFAGLEFSRRGMHVLAVDGPGQGETLRMNKIASRPDYEVAGTAVFDYLVNSRPEVDLKRVTVMGYSFGGYLAPRIAGLEKRYAGCVAFGAMHWDLHGWQREIKQKLAKDAKTSFSSVFQFRWVVGAPDNDTAMEWAKKFTLEGVADKIECPVLVMHGENDRIVPVEEARTLYERIGSRKKTLKIYTREDGGAEHCQVDDRPMGVDYMADWIEANVNR
jgi:alpha-beta hydrolase superfamily lysophospholipase